MRWYITSFIIGVVLIWEFHTTNLGDNTFKVGTLMFVSFILGINVFSAYILHNMEAEQ